jgi:hypothetical protein
MFARRLWVPSVDAGELASGRTERAKDHQQPLAETGCDFTIIKPSNQSPILFFRQIDPDLLPRLALGGIQCALI